MATTVGQLDTYFLNLVNSLMLIERQPLERLQTQKTTLSTQQNIYSDLNSKLGELQTQLKSLTSTDTSTALVPGQTLTVTGAASGKTVLTAANGSGAVAGQYDLTNISLAVAERQKSTLSISSADVAVGKTGDIWLGGNGTASASISSAGVATEAGTGTVTSGQRELGAGAYTVETRDYNGTLQFRLKNSDNIAVSIAAQGATDGSFTNSWQNVTAGSYDTGRGLTLTLAASGGNATVNYTAAGAKATIEASDTLLGIAAKINDVIQPEGRELQASVVGTTLVMTAANSGANHTMIYTDNAGLGMTSLTSAADASFKVNGISFTRSNNSGLTDVIHGVTLNLAADAAGQSASLVVADNMNGARTAIDAFVAKFNQIMSYVDEKTSISSINQDGKTAYSRAALADDSAVSELRTQLFSTFMSSVENSGSYTSLRDIGLTIDNNLKATVSDSTKLEEALTNNLSGVKALLDKAMTSFDATLNRFTATSDGYVNTMLSSITRQIQDAGSNITSMNSYLAQREQILVDQFAQVQTTLYTMQYSQQTWSSIYNAQA